MEDTPTEECNIGGHSLPRELLDNGQDDSSSSDMDISNDSSSNEEETPLPAKHTKTNGAQLGIGKKLLLPPIIEKTGKSAMGATAHILRKQNQIHCNEALLNQAIATQWITYHGKILLQIDCWEGRLKTLAQLEMAPQGLALQHEAASLLTDWEKFGCPTRMGQDWTIEEIQATIDQGPHE
jgi:hypothetical protein